MLLLQINQPNPLFIALAITMIVVGLTVFVVVAMIPRHWLRATLSGEPVAAFQIIGMRLRGSPPGLLIDAYIVLKKKGIDTSIAEVEKIYIANKDRIRDCSDLIDRVQEVESA